MNHIFRADLSVVLSHHTLQPLNSVCICLFQLIKDGVNAFYTLFTQHPYSNLLMLYELHHMVLHHVKFGCYCGVGESRSIVGEELIDINQTLWRKKAKKQVQY